MSVGSSQIEPSNDGIFEPGEIVFISNLSAVNVGGMPTPPYQHLELQLVSNNWVQFSAMDALRIEQSLGIGASYLFPGKLKFAISDYNTPQVDGAFNYVEKVRYDISVSRVNRSFKNLQAPDDRILIQYPVQASQVQSARSIKSYEEAPLAIGVSNLSLLDIGIGSLQQRIVNLIITQESGQEQVEFVPKAPENYVNLNSMRQADLLGEVVHQQIIQVLPARQQEVISGTLRFTNPDIPPYSKTKLNCSLDIGDLNNPSQYTKRI